MKHQQTPRKRGLFFGAVAELQQPACNAADFFQTQPDLAVGRVVDAGNVALMAERPRLPGHAAGRLPQRR